jgi:glutamine synthetase
MTDAKKVLEIIKENDVKYVDFRFTDPRGKWQHTAQHVSTVDEDMLNDGIMFDGSSIAGWKAINESDMTLKPDLSTAVMDPFAAQPQLILICDVLEPSTGQPYGRDPRSIARRAEAFLKSSGIGDTSFFGPEAEFFVFDTARFKTDMYEGFYHLDSEEGPWNSGKDLPDGNLGHRPAVKGGYFPVPPVDSATDLRAEMVSVLADMGVGVEKHHHEVAAAQHELGIKFGTLLYMADSMQKYKYVVHNVAHQYGKTATFMPKPIYKDNGSGMHVHQSIWKDGKPLFAGNGYADLSEMCLFYIGGIIKHAKAINAYTNPTTNSYKRLVPGYEAPVLLAYSSRNRSASCRIPYSASPKGKRVEVRFPDPACNPYLGFSAMLMAGIDGIVNKIHPGQAMDKNLYDLPPEELKQVPTVCGSLREAMENLDKDRAFLKRGDVFTDDQIDAYIELRMEEVLRFETTPHPVEFEMYYSV